MALSKSRKIKNALVTHLSGLQLNGEPAFTQVLGHPRGEFEGYPSVRVLPGDQLTQKASISQNDRTVTYLVRTHMPAKDNGSEFDSMYDLTDLIIDSLDSADFANTLTTIDPTIGQYVLNTTQASWFDTDTQTGVVLMCDINVEVKYSKDN